MQVKEQTNTVFFNAGSLGKAQNTATHQNTTYKVPATELLKSSWPGPW